MSMDVSAIEWLKNGRPYNQPVKFIDKIKSDDLYSLIHSAKADPSDLFENLEENKNQWISNFNAEKIVPTRIELLKKIMDADIFCHLILNDIAKEYKTKSMEEWTPFPFDNGELFMEYLKKRFHAGSKCSREVSSSFFKKVSDNNQSAVQPEIVIKPSKAEIYSILDKLFEDKREPTPDEIEKLKSQNGKANTSKYIKRFKGQFFPHLVEILLAGNRITSVEINEIIDPPCQFIADKIINAFINSIQNESEFSSPITARNYSATIHHGQEDIKIIVLE